MEPRTRDRIRERERQKTRETETNDTEKKSGSRKGLIIAFIVFMLAVNGVLIFLNFNKSAQIEEKEVTIVDQKKEIDSKNAELKSAIQELEAKKAELAQYGADTTRLYNELQSVKERLASVQNIEKDYFRIKKELQRVKYLVSETEAELAKYKAQVDTLTKSNSELKSQLTQNEQNMNELKSSREELSKKVEIAGLLRAEDVRTYTLSAKGKEKEGGDYKVKDIDVLRVSFLLGENKIAKAEGKNIILRVIEPDGGALFDLGTGGGSFNQSGKEVFYTMKQDVLYDNKSQQVTFDYKKGSPYKVGEHKIEIYSEGHKIGESSFNVH